MACIEHQMSIFEMIESREVSDRLTRCLMQGSGYEGGRIRIYAAAVNLSDKALAVFLKEEYGDGGCSFENGFIDYNAKGISFRAWKKNTQESCSWGQAVKRIKGLIAADMYLHPAERTKLNAIRKSHDGKLPAPYPRLEYS